MTKPDTTSHEILAADAYADERHLRSRQSLYAWQEPRYDLPDLVLRHLPSSARTLLDVGCGNGRYIGRVRAGRPGITTLGLDISPGILSDVTPPVAVAGAEALPIANARADVVLAMHMLYHVSDIDAALAETVRVLRPGGVLIASTNGRDDKRELDDLWSAAAADVLGLQEGPSRISLSNRFALDDAPGVLSRFYTRVDTVELPGTITVDTPEPVIAHLASYRTWAEQSGVPFEATLNRATEHVSAAIRRDGVFRVTCRGGLLLCDQAK